MIGQRLSHFQITAKLGQGGMGEVFLAEDRKLGRKVALKVLPEQVRADARARRRFLREARAAAAIDHPYICHIHEIVEEGEHLCIALEYVEGRTLEQRLAQGPIALGEGLRAAIEIAEALGHAHATGIAHRDLKPSNIMLTAAGHVKVMDFGLAKRLDQGREDQLEGPTLTALTQVGTVLGTPAYMAPEQIRGQPVDHRADIFSFGLVLFELLTGKNPFLRRNLQDTAIALVTEPTPTLSSFGIEAPKVLERTVAKMLAKSKEDRYRSVQEVRDELSQLVTQPLLPDRGGRRTARRATLDRLTTPVAGFLLLLLVLGIGWRLSRTAAQRSQPSATLEVSKAEWVVDIDPRSVAVLPFANLDGRPELDYISTGITEEILALLSRVGALRVTPLSLVLPFRDAETGELERIAERLRVATLLTGGVSQRDEGVRIEMRLVDPRAGRVVFDRVFQSRGADLFAIESEATLGVARALGASVSQVERARIEQQPTADMSAYDFYLQGRQSYYRYTPEDNENAIRLFRRALDKDPGYALARAGLADAYSQRVHQFGFDEVWLETAIGVAREAIDADPELAEAYKSLGLAYGSQGKLRASIEASLRAVDINPNLHAAITNLGFFTLATGDPGAALAWFRKARAVAPMQPVAYAGSGFVYLFLDDYERAEQWFERALELGPRFLEANVGLVSLFLVYGEYDAARSLTRGMLETGDLALAAAGDVELYAGRLTEALGYYERASAAPIDSIRLLLGRPSVKTLIGYIRLKADETAEAESMLTRSERAVQTAIDGGSEWPGFAIDLAAVQAVRGNLEAAKPWLQTAIDGGFLHFRSVQTDPLLAGLRDDPDFKRMVKSLERRVSTMRAELETAQP